MCIIISHVRNLLVNKVMINTRTLHKISPFITDCRRINMGSASSLRNWEFCGSKFSKSAIVYFTQVMCIYILLCYSLYQLSTSPSGPLSTFWCGIITSSVAYMLPNPKLKFNKVKPTDVESHISI